MLISRRHILSAGAAFLAQPLLASQAPIVFAAASLKTALDKIAKDVVPMRLSYGGSGALARQILQGAPADVFLSANSDWMDVVVAGGLVKDRPIDLLGNQLVLAGHIDAPPVDLSDWNPDGRISMGFVDGVPAGQYGKAALQAAGLWDAVRPNVVEVENVRAALALVTRRELPYAIVYASDVQADPSSKVLHSFAKGTHPKITYPLARFTETGLKVVQLLQGPEAGTIFVQTGFKVL